MQQSVCVASISAVIISVDMLDNLEENGVVQSENVVKCYML